MSAVTLLEEELALLAPEAEPLPWLDALEERELAGVLRSSARSLVLRGLAEPGEDGLRPAGALAGLVRSLGAGASLRVAVAVEGQVRDPLVVLRPAGDGEDGVVVQDVGADGVHVLTGVGRGEVAGLLRGLLDPLEGAPGTAVVQVGLSVGGREDTLLLVGEAGSLLRAREHGADPVDGAALDRLVEELLVGLLQP